MSKIRKYARPAKNKRFVYGVLCCSAKSLSTYLDCTEYPTLPTRAMMVTSSPASALVGLVCPSLLIVFYESANRVSPIGQPAAQQRIRFQSFHVLFLFVRIHGHKGSPCAVCLAFSPGFYILRIGVIQKTSSPRGPPAVSLRFSL